MSESSRCATGLRPGYSNADLDRERARHHGENGVTAEEIDEEAMDRV